MEVVYRFVEFHSSLIHTHIEGFVTFEHADVPSTANKNTNTHTGFSLCHEHNIHSDETHTVSEACIFKLSPSVLISDNTLCCSKPHMGRYTHTHTHRIIIVVMKAHQYRVLLRQ